MFLTYIEYVGCCLNQASIVAAEHHPLMRIDRSRNEVVSQACRMATSSLAMKGCLAACSRTIRSQYLSSRCDASTDRLRPTSYLIAIQNIGRLKSFVDDLDMEWGIVRMRVGLSYDLLRFSLLFRDLSGFRAPSTFAG